MPASNELDFFGHQTCYPSIRRGVAPRIYLDSAASTLMMTAPYRAREALLAHYSNIHSETTLGARICTQQFQQAANRILAYFGYAPEDYVCEFVGAGATAALNRAARYFSALQAPTDTVLVSLMEHHSNDLPHRRHGLTVVHVGLNATGDTLGTVDLSALEAALASRSVRYVAVTACSNVTGILNPLERITELVHAYGAYLLVDATQQVAHAPWSAGLGADALAFSGHKVYAPGTPGVLLLRKTLADAAGPQEWGGGLVDTVDTEGFRLRSDGTDHSQAGTPDVLGAVQLAEALTQLQQLGPVAIHVQEQRLWMRARAGLAALANRTHLYGDPSTPCAGLLSFTLRDLPHAEVARRLNDEFNIAVRSGCFCAQPYVRALLQQADQASGPDAGLVRVSFGLYNTEADVDLFLNALEHISNTARR